MARKVRLTPDQVRDRLGELRTERLRRNHARKACERQEVYTTYWNNLSATTQRHILKALEDDIHKKKIARAVGYSYSFIVWVYVHKHLPQGDWI